METKIKEINAVLRAEMPGRMILQSYDVRGRKLVIAFTCAGGPKEDFAFRLQFEMAMIFHLPSVLYDEICFRKAIESECELLIPNLSYDSGEFSGKEGVCTLLLTDSKGEPTGYYIAAESVNAEWVPRESCLMVW